MFCSLQTFRQRPPFCFAPVKRVHNRVLRSRLPAYFSLLIPPSRSSLGQNPDPAAPSLFSLEKVILIKIKTYLYTMGSKYGTITIRKHALINYVSKEILALFPLKLKILKINFHCFKKLKINFH